MSLLRRSCTAALCLLAVLLFVEATMSPLLVERPLPLSCITNQVRNGYVAHVFPVYPLLWEISENEEFQILEDGRAIGKLESFQENVKAIGKGRYIRYKERLYFSTSDNSTPFDNGRRYSLRFAVEAPAWFVALLVAAALLLNFRAAALLITRLSTLHPAWIAGVLLLVSVGYRLFLWWHNYSGMVSGHMLFGMPFSDGRQWDTMAKEFAEGHGFGPSTMVWDARRPMYYWIIGPIYALLGAHPALTVGLKFILSCSLSVFIFDALRRIAPFPVALIAGLYHATLRYDGFEWMVVQSDGIAHALMTISFWVFAVAQHRILSRPENHKVALCRRDLALSMLSAGGFILAASNMTPPFTLLSLGIVPVIFAWTSYRRNRDGREFLKNTLLFGVVICGSAALLIGPWILRQGVKYGIWSISDNSVQVLVGAADPNIKRWGTAVTEMYGGNRLDLASQYKFYSDEFKETRKKHPDFYLENIKANLLVAFESVRAPVWSLLLAVALALVFAMSRVPIGTWRSRDGIFPLVVAGALALACARSEWWWVVSILSAVAVGSPILLLAAPIIAGILVMGVTCLVLERMFIDLIWPAVALASWGAWMVINYRAGQDAERLFEQVPEWGDSWRKSFRLLLVGILSFLFLGYLRIGYRFLTRSESGMEARLSSTEESKFIEITKQSAGCQIFSPLYDRLKAYKGLLRPGYLIHIPAFAFIPHYSPLFREKEFSYYVFEIEPTLPSMYASSILNPVSDGSSAEQIYVGIATESQNQQNFEVIDILHFDRQSTSWVSAKCGGESEAVTSYALDLLRN